MTHTLHRRGDVESLQCDNPVLVMTARGINRVGSAPKLRKLFDIIERHQPANFSQRKLGNIFRYSPSEMLATLTDESYLMAVFSDPNKLREFLTEVKEADVGLSIIVSGLIEQIQALCDDIGLECHSIDLSGGIMGNVDKLPEEEILEITTMCGHAMVSADLVRSLVMDIKSNKTTIREASRLLAAQCHCGVFNPERAEEILRNIVDSFFWARL